MLFTTYSPQPCEALVCHAVQKVHWMQEKEAGTEGEKVPRGLGFGSGPQIGAAELIRAYMKVLAKRQIQEANPN